MNPVFIHIWYKNLEKKDKTAKTYKNDLPPARDIFSEQYYIGSF